jgi:hypothetical protein
VGIFQRFGWRSGDVTEPGQSRHVRAMRAAGMRIKPSTEGGGNQLRAVAQARQQWQPLAWRYRDSIPELRFAMGYRSSALSRIRLFPALVISDDDEPIPLSLIHDKDPKKAAQIDLPPDLVDAAQAMLDRLPLDDGFTFLGAWSENFDAAGECWLHGTIDPDTGDEQWRIRSIDEVWPGQDGRTCQIDDDDNPGQRRYVQWDEEELYRLWVPHPRRGILADSPCQAALDVFEDIVLIGREIRAAARSRIAANGLLMFPNTMTLARNTNGEVDGVSVDSDEFMGELTSALLAPITNEGDAGAVVPLVLTGDAEDIKAVTHLQLARETSPELAAKLEEALRRMGRGMDLPPEIIAGLGDSNHWSAWQIDASTFRYHLEPGARRMVDSLTVAYLRYNLIEDGWDPKDVKRIRIWYDAGNITENTNRRQDALDAFAVGGIGYDALLQALGFNDGDKPSDDETLRMLLFKTAFDPLTASQLIQRVLTPKEPIVLPTRETVSIGDKGGAPADGITKEVTEPAGLPAGPSGGVGAPPATPPGLAADGHAVLERLSAKLSMVAAAVYDDPDYDLVFDDYRDIVAIEQALRERIITAADTMLADAVRRGASKLRSKFSGDTAISAELRARPYEEWGAFIGRDRALTAGATADFLIAGAFATLGGKFTQWTLAAIDRIATKLVRMLRIPAGSDQAHQLHDRVHADMAGRVNNGWHRLNGDLEELADKVLHGEYTPPTNSELADTRVPPGMVRAVLADIGGIGEGAAHVNSTGRSSAPAAGLASGSTVQATLAERGAVNLGYLWVYGVTLAPDNFIPHLNIEGIRFADWSDPQLDPPSGYEWLGDHMHPGDHQGCMCDYVPAYAVPKYGQQVAQRLTKPSVDMANIISLAQMDDQAGRKNTNAQAMRDQWERIQKLQARFINGGKVAS